MAGILQIRHKNPNKQSIIKEQDKFLISKQNEKRQVPVHVNYNGLIYILHILVKYFALKSELIA